MAIQGTVRSEVGQEGLVWPVAKWAKQPKTETVLGGSQWMPDSKGFTDVTV